MSAKFPTRPNNAPKPPAPKDEGHLSAESRARVQSADIAPEIIAGLLAAADAK